MSYCIARRIATIDALIEAACDRPREMVQDGLWRLMRMGVYQLAWLASIPPHAAIHETVELARRLGQPGWCGFLNAVLRRLQRDILPIDQAGWTSVRSVEELVRNPDAAWLPLRGLGPRAEGLGPEGKDGQLGNPTGTASTLTPNPSPGGRGEPEGNSSDHPPSAISHQPTNKNQEPGTKNLSAPQPSTLNSQPSISGLQLRQPVFPDPYQYRAAHWADAFSFPEWMIDEWCLELGEVAAVERASWFNSAGKMCLRVNLWKATRESMLGALQRMGVEATPGRWPESIILETPVPVAEIPGFRDGLVSIQDESAISAAALLAPQPGWRVLDMCAAPGGKTAHMAEQMRNQGQIVACDTVALRLPLIHQNCERLGISIVETREVAEDDNQLPDGPFDAALVDVPCSNTGVLGKRPEVRWRYVPGELRELMPIQMRLLRQALDRVKSGGRVVYSTCSVDSRENNELVRTVLNTRSDAELAQELHHQPGHPVDGGYAALIVKR
jgi:16S rRNA C967 or C1407 C5-methylase (RsmB/RsmF family)